MAIYKHGQGFEFVATVKQIQAFSRVELQPGTARLVFTINPVSHFVCKEFYFTTTPSPTKTFSSEMFYSTPKILDQFWPPLKIE